VYKLARFKVAIVIPAYNEEDTIGDVSKSVKKYGDVIVVNDASCDSTRMMALQSGSIVINHARNKGYDEALNSGFIEANKRGYDAVITFDADGQHSYEAIGEYITHLKNGKDLVLGVRPSPARVAEWIFMLYTRVKFNWKDPLCGMKGYSMHLYRKQGYFDSYGSIGTELSVFALTNKYSYAQLNIDINKRKGSPRFYSKLTSNWHITRSLIKLFLRV
jgi:glycosyltransferase involved in cell wall biosynthesis